MAFIHMDNTLLDKSFTSLENKFITKYLPVLPPMTVKVYIYMVYICRNNLSTYSPEDVCKVLGLTDEEFMGHLDYLEEFELITISSRSPVEIEICDCSDLSGKPKKFKKEKYADFTKSIQAIFQKRMIPPSEYAEYVYLLEEFGFDQDALLMIIGYCVSMKGDDVRIQYVKRVITNFATDGDVTMEKVSQRLSSYTAASTSVIKLFALLKINKTPDIFDEQLYRKWTTDYGFSEDAIVTCSKCEKAKSMDRIDRALGELYKNKKFDVVEIKQYYKDKDSVYNATIEIGRSLGVYMSMTAPFIESYVNPWVDHGYTLDALKYIAQYCFKKRMNSFEDMDNYIKGLLAEGIVDFGAVQDKIISQEADDELVREILNFCGLSRKVLKSDTENLHLWRDWGFTKDMLLKAASLSDGKNNPVAYMNGILSSWKSQNIYSLDAVQDKAPNVTKTPQNVWDKAKIENHYSMLRQKAEEKADKALAIAESNDEYNEVHSLINSLAISLAMSEIDKDGKDKEISKQLDEAKEREIAILKGLNLTLDDLVPKYSCKICGDTGYDKQGRPCECLKKLISEE